MAAPDLIKTIDEFEAEYRKGIGAVLPHHPTKQASLDNIRNFCEGIGDYKPAVAGRGAREKQPLRHDHRAPEFPL